MSVKLAGPSLEKELKFVTDLEQELSHPGLGVSGLVNL